MDLIVLNSDRFVPIKVRTENAIIVEFAGHNEVKEEYFSYLKEEKIAFNELLLLEEFEKNKNQIKSEYLDWVQAFPYQKISNQTIKEFLAFGHGFSLWWTTLLAEKNPLKTNAVHNSLKLIALNSLLAKHSKDFSNIVIVSNDPKISTTIKNLFPTIPAKIYLSNGEKNKDIKTFLRKSTLFSGIFVFLREMYYTMLASRLVLKKPQGKKNCIHSYFPGFNKESMEKGVFESKYWGKKVQQIIEGKNGSSYLLQYVTNEELSYREAVNNVEKLNNNSENDFYLIEQFNKIGDLVKSFILFFKLSKKFSRVFKPDFFRFYNSNLNFFEIHKDDLAISLKGSELARVIIWCNAFKNFFEFLPRSDFFYPMEMQGWETILNYFAHRKNHRTFGTIHATVKNLMLNFFNSKSAYLEKEFGYPLPSNICYNSSPCKKFFAEQGLKNLEKIEANRFAYLGSVGSSFAEGEDRKRLLITTSINYQESKDLLEMFAEACKNSDQKFHQVFIKPHPYLPLEPILKKIVGFPKFEYSNKPVLELLKDSNYLLCTNSSSVLIEGLMCGVKTITVVNLKNLNMNPIDDHELLTIVKSKSELIQAFEKRLPHDSRPLKDYFFLSEDFRLWKALLEKNSLQS